MFDQLGLVAPEATPVAEVPIAIEIGRPQERDQRRQRRQWACVDRERRLARKRQAKARESMAQWEAFYASLSARERPGVNVCVRCGAEAEKLSCGLCEACTY